MNIERVKFASPPDNQGLLRGNGIKITTSPEIFHEISEKYGIPWTEVRYIDLNRTGICLPEGEVRVDFRARFVTKDQLAVFFDKKEQDGLDIRSLRQIAVVTGLFGSEKGVIEHMKLVHQVVTPRGFDGELLYFGCEVNSQLLPRNTFGD